MKTEDYINDFIKKEKATEPNPFLVTRIMAKIDAPVSKSVKIWQSLAVAASFSLVIFIGIEIGNSYNTASNYAVLNLNDSNIENLSIYNYTENE